MNPTLKTLLVVISIPIVGLFLLIALSPPVVVAPSKVDVYSVEEIAEAYCDERVNLSLEELSSCKASIASKLTIIMRRWEHFKQLKGEKK